MNIKQLLKKLEGIPVDTEIISYSTYDRGYTDRINVEIYEHDGKDFDCFHSQHPKTDSNVRSGIYLLIDIDE